jgi:spermidine/putrescine transport system ATP-binding protein
VIKKTYLEFKNVGKTYDDGFTAVEGFDLKINKGDFVTFLGPSGCGKTTVLRMLAGFETVSEGTICINGNIINDIPPNKRVTSTVFQDYALFPNLTVAGNIKFGLKLFRVPNESTNLEKIKVKMLKDKKQNLIKANHNIKELQKDIVALQKDLSKAISKYDKHPE